jgi:hypothetical protein
MKPVSFKVAVTKLTEAFVIICRDNPEAEAYFRDCLITDIRFSSPRGRQRVTIRGKCIRAKETRCMKITEG